MKFIPVVDLYRHKTTSRFTVVNYCEHEGFHVAVPCGRMIEHSLEEIRVDGLRLVTGYLQDYPSRRRIEESEFERLTEADRIGFRKSNSLVSISLQRGAELWIDPMHWLRDGVHMTSLGPAERLVIKVTDNQSEFFQGISAALKAAD